jgi:hypothetical protein
MPSQSSGTIGGEKQRCDRGAAHHESLGSCPPTARPGSNEYTNEDVLSFYNAISPDVFALLGALNSKLNRDDMVTLHYVDLLDDQTPNESHLDLIYLHNKLKSLEGYWERAALKRYLYITPPLINNGRNFRVYHTTA